VNHTAVKTFRKIFADLKHGEICHPRGMKVLELEHYTYAIPPGVRFMSFPSRKFNLQYLKTEFLWYLKGDLYDTSIGDHAKIWRSIVHPKGFLNSNYGHYVFQEGGWLWVVEELQRDKDSRRASITILNRGHLDSEQLDVPCTYALNFRIRNNRLNMSVHMRSQDCIFGMGNDLPCFSIIYEMIYVYLRDKHYPDLQLGVYWHTADSFHVYERHFEMLHSLLLDADYEDIDCPPISSAAEVDFLINTLPYVEDKKLLTQQHPDFKFTGWLVN
jgi:thymidylate synthase